VAWLAERLAGRCAPARGKFLVEMMSNDGVGLEASRQAGFDVLGVDPSNVAAEAEARGLPSVREFFGVQLAERLRAERGPADVIVARHALAHLSEVRDLLAGVRLLLRPGGVFLVEVPYALMLREEVQYDTIFHEHPFFWTVASLRTVLGRHGLRLTDLAFVPVNGGSILAEVRHEGAAEAPGLQAVLDLEGVLRLNQPEGWELFARRVHDQRDGLRRLLGDLAGDGATVVGYGAAAKFMIMLNFCGITPELVRQVGDMSPRKQGLLCPGVRIPVVSPETLMESAPDYVLIGAWNLRDEIIRFFREKLHYRNRFVLPLPTPRII
jgi:SAM-dependent methyltransferase